MMAFSKVLSPQYFIWLLPVAALAGLEEPILGALTFATLLLTQINFPAKYWDLVYLEPSSVKWLAVRNVALVVCFLVRSSASSGCRRHRLAGRPAGMARPEVPCGWAPARRRDDEPLEQRRGEVRQRRQSA